MSNNKLEEDECLKSIKSTREDEIDKKSSTTSIKIKNIIQNNSDSDSIKYCSAIINDIIDSSFKSCDFEGIKYENNSCYLSIYEEELDYIHQLEKAGSSNLESQKSPKFNESLLKLNQDDQRKPEILVLHSGLIKGLHLVQSEQNSGISVASDPEEIINDAIKNNLQVKEVKETLDFTKIPIDYSEEIVTHVHYSKQNYANHSTEEDVPTQLVNVASPCISGDYNNEQTNTVNENGELRTYRISEYDLPPNYSSIIYNDNGSYRGMHENIPLSCIMTRYGEPRPSAPFIYRIPPPSYNESESVRNDISLSSLAVMSPFWGPNPQPAMCPCCNSFCISRARHRICFGTHLFAMFMCICLCWPCCILPYYTPACKYTEHYCPHCSTLLGIYDPWGYS